MTNRLVVIPIGDQAPAQDIVTALSSDGTTIPIKNKYYEADIKVDFEITSRPLAVLWAGAAKFVDVMPPDAKPYENSELRLLLRVIDDDDNEEYPEKLRDWEIDTMSEVINVKLHTLDEEIKNFRDGKAHSSLLDEEAGPAGSRILEALEMVPWPIQTVAGKPIMDQKIEQMVKLLKSEDPECDNFDQAMQIMMELKGTIPKLPDEEKHKYAAMVAMAFQEMMGPIGEEEDKKEEDGDETPTPAPSGESA